MWRPNRVLERQYSKYCACTVCTSLSLDLSEISDNFREQLLDTKMFVNHRYVVVVGVGQNMQNGILLRGEMDCGNNLTKTNE